MKQTNKLPAKKPEKEKKYEYLSDAERSEIAILLKRNLSKRDIARALEPIQDLPPNPKLPFLVLEFPKFLNRINRYASKIIENSVLKNH